jgi:hypothetical protein
MAEFIRTDKTTKAKRRRVCLTVSFSWPSELHIMLDRNQFNFQVTHLKAFLIELDVRIEQ